MPLCDLSESERLEIMLLRERLTNLLVRIHNADSAFHADGSATISPSEYYSLRLEVDAIKQRHPEWSNEINTWLPSG